MVAAAVMLVAGPVASGEDTRDDGYSHLLFSTFVGGSQVEWAHAVELGPDGSVYMAGYTLSYDPYTTEGAFQRVTKGGEEIYVMKMAADGSTIEWATLVGGSGIDIAWDLALGPDGAVYVTGYTSSTDLPTTLGAISGNLDGTTDAFVLCLAPDGGSLRYCTYLGGEDNDHGYAILVTGGGDAYVAGDTESQLFPTTAGAYDRMIGGTSDAFLARISPDGRTLKASTYLGGMYTEWEPAMTMDGDGDLWITGSTTSPDYPTSKDAYVTSGSRRDVFITEVLPGLTAINASTVIGREGNDVPRSIDVRNDGFILVGGFSSSADFPNRDGVVEPENNGETDGLLLSMPLSLEEVDSAVMLGANGFDVVRSAMYDQHGYIHVTGYTNSTTFPTTADAFQGSGTKTTEDHDVFYMRVVARGLSLHHSTLIGGPSRDIGMDLALDRDLVPVIVGHSWSSTFPVEGDVFDRVHNGDGDIIALRYTHDTEPPVISHDNSYKEVNRYYSMLFSVGVSDGSWIGGVQVEYWLDDGDPVTLDMRKVSSYEVMVQVPADVKTLHYRFIAWDVLGRINTTDVRTVPVPDHVLPWLVADLTPGTATTGDDLEFLVQLADNNRLDRAYVEWELAGEEFNLSLSSQHGFPGSWNRTLLIPSDTTAPVPYRFVFVDEVGNWNSTDIGTIDVWDNDPPVLGELDLPRNAMPGSNVTIDVTAWDNLGIVDAWLNHRTGPGVWHVIDIEPSYEPFIVVEVPIPSGSGDVFIELHAKDAADNQVTVTGIIPYSDRAPPRILILSTSVNATTGDLYMITWEARDPWGVDGMWLMHAFGESPAIVDYHVGIPDSMPSATMEIPVPEDSTDPLWMILKASDLNGNVNETDPIRVTVVDDDPPVADAGEDLKANQRTNISFDASASSDNIGIVRYVWSWSTPGLDDMVERTTEGPLWEWTFTEAGTYTVLLEVVDAAGNTANDTVKVKVGPPEDEGTGNIWASHVFLSMVILVGAVLAAVLYYFHERRGTP